MKIVCYGDSNTWGYDPRSYFGGRYNAPWPEILSEKTGWNVINSGQNGREIPGTPVSFPEDMELLVIMLGTNDLLQGNIPEQITARMEAFLNALSTKNILLIAPPAMVFGEWVQDQSLIDASVRLAEYYQELAGRLGIHFVDSSKWNLSLTFDGVHLSEKGHRIFADKIAECIKVLN